MWDKLHFSDNIEDISEKMIMNNLLIINRIISILKALEIIDGHK